MGNYIQKPVVLDIETIPDPSMLSRLPEPEVKLGNLKDTFKIQAKLDEARGKQIEKMALNPMHGKICCACTYNEEISESYISTNEAEIIESLFDKILCYQHEIITFNGIRFDLPFIYKRALILGVKVDIPLDYWTKRYSYQPHCDLDAVWSNWNNTVYTKLDDLAERLLNKNKIDVNFKDFPVMMNTQSGRDNIAEYCMLDCELTFQLYKMFKGVLIQ